LQITFGEHRRSAFNLYST